MVKRQTTNLQTVRFFPIFLAATLAVMIDSVQLLIDETVVGNLFDDVAFGAINLLEPYLLLEEFFSYLIVTIQSPANNRLNELPLNASLIAV